MTGAGRSPDRSPRKPAGAVWIVTVLAAGFISAMTAPGQTVGLSVFTDPLIDELGIDRSQLSLSYLIATLIGASAQPLIGRAADRWDIRKVMCATALALALSLLLLSVVSEFFGLTFGYIGVRMAGQGALSLAVTTAVSRMIVHRRGLALGVMSAIGTAGISLSPIALEPLIASVGAQAAWRWEALVVVVVVFTAAALLPRPVTPGERRGSEPVGRGYTVAEARRTGMFWVLAAAVSTSAMLGTALGFHQISLLGERGLSSFEAAANFLPQTATGLISTLLVGALIDRYDPRIFVVFSMATIAGAMAVYPFIAGSWSAVLYGLILGASGGSLRGMEAAAFVKYYGVAHIGAIRGLSMMMVLGASALGPYALSIGRDLAAGFTAPVLILGALPLLVIVAVALVRPPPGRAVTG
ncbi:MFS transporter [Zhihengliuella halotolerans]|uniref:MFS transporter n=1 Tax=Zhihengliuella halotolerans TaxID=370736 RepID=UPI0021557E91|nr:MFS transporter [Zhihengliuella halotolerans]